MARSAASRTVRLVSGRTKERYDASLLLLSSLCQLDSTREGPNDALVLGQTRADRQRKLGYTCESLVMACSKRCAVLNEPLYISSSK